MLALVSFNDFVIVLAWALFGGIILTLLCRSRRLDHLARGCLIIGSVFLALFGVANVSIYSALRMPLTYPLLVNAGDIADIPGSIASNVHLATIITMIATPIVYLGLVIWVQKSNWPGSKSVRVVLTALIAAYCAAGAYGHARWRYSGRQEEGLAKSPHWTFVASVIDHWRGDSTVGLHDDAHGAFREDFATVGQRSIAPRAAPASPKIKNVVFVVLESTGTQFLQVYGSPYPTTPCLKAEASHSRIFRNVYSNEGSTLHAMMTLTLSLYPGTGWETYVSSHPRLPGTSAAQVLHDRGYRTAFMQGGKLDFRGSRRFFENRGFDSVEGFEDFQRKGIGQVVSPWGMDDPPLFDSAFQWIANDSAKPFFLMLWTQQTHHPYTLAPNQSYQQYIDDRSREPARQLDLYLNDLHIVDEQLGRLFDFLRRKHLADSTLVVITGDHGEGFGFPHPWLLHGTSLYQEAINVPCIFWNPAIFAEGETSNAVGAHVDLLPSIMDLLTLPAPPAWQGRSLFDPQRPNRAYFTTNNGNLLLGLRDGDYKFIYNVTLGREELFNLASDPTEQSNRAKADPIRSREYRQRLSAMAAFERSHLATLTSQEH